MRSIITLISMLIIFVFEANGQPGTKYFYYHIKDKDGVALSHKEVIAIADEQISTANTSELFLPQYIKKLILIHQNEVMEINFFYGQDPDGHNKLFLRRSMQITAPAFSSGIYNLYFSYDETANRDNIDWKKVADLKLDLSQINAEKALAWTIERANTVGPINNLRTMLALTTQKIDLNRALSLAVSQGCNEIIELLLEHGADVKSLSEKALINACRFGHIKTLKLIMNLGFDLRVNTAYDGTTLLAAAIAGNQIEIIKMLISAGANVNLDPTYLALAVNFFDLEIAKLLLKKGLNTKVTFTSIYGPYGTRISVATNALAEAFGCYISGFNADLDCIYDNSCDHYWKQRYKREVTDKLLKTVQMLVSIGANINIRDYNSDTLLMIAVRSENAKLVKLLLKLGANVNLKDSKGRTALIIAKQRKNATIINLFTGI